MLASHDATEIEMAPFHFLHQDNWTEMQTDLLVIWFHLHWHQCQVTPTVSSIAQLHSLDEDNWGAIWLLQSDAWRAFREIRCSISEASRKTSKTEAIKMWVVQKRIQRLWACIFQRWNFNWSRQDESGEGEPEPITITDVRSFVGFVTYYRRFVKDFSKMSRPLNKLLGNSDERQSRSKQRKKDDGLKWWTARGISEVEGTLY